MWKLLRTRWYIWRIVRHVSRLNAGKPVGVLVIPASIADLIYELALEAGEREWAVFLLSLPRE